MTFPLIYRIRHFKQNNTNHLDALYTSIFDFFASHATLFTYLLIPIISGIVGWGTNVLALKMTFYPTEFKGIPPLIGWQGIIPAKAGVMAEKAVDMLTTKLINVQEIFERIDPERVAAEMEHELQRSSKMIIDEIMEAQAPALWKGVPQLVKYQMYQQGVKDLPVLVTNMFQEIKDDIEDLFDLKSMVVIALTKDKDLLNEIFLKCGDQEFRFIERSGMYFGFLFGLIQMTICYFYNPWWMLPLAGLLVGYATNWLALKLIFEPVEPKQMFGYTVQGLFMKRQKEVAVEYSKIVVENILNIENILYEMIEGPSSDKLKAMIARYVSDVVDKTAGNSKQVLELLAGKNRYEIVKNMAHWSFIQELPILITEIFDYAEEALDIENTLAEKMTELPAEQFQGLLRPVFQEDELKLIIIGAVLGCLAGAAQVALFFS